MNCAQHSEFKPDVPCYAAVIRAYNHTHLLEETVASLRRQSTPPKTIIIVDSSRNPAVTTQFANLADLVVQYPDEEFNFSKAINVGVAAHDLPLTLIVSSHVVFEEGGLVSAGWAQAQDGGCEIVFWVPHETLYNVTIKINLGNFSGRNGISNSSALIPTHLIRERPFREEVFSAEDQEFTMYYLRRFRHPVLRIETKALKYLNPHHGAKNWSEVKILNEELAIGYYVNRRLLMPDRILARVLRGILATVRRRPIRARLHFEMAKALLLANFIAPKRQSRYFDQKAE